MWNLVPDKLKQLVEIQAFKKEIKKGKPKNCPYRLCKTCIPYVDFIQIFKFVLAFETHSAAVHQKLSYGGVFWRENSSAFTSYFLSAFSIGTSESFLFIIYLFYYSFIYLFICLFIYFQIHGSEDTFPKLKFSE